MVEQRPSKATRPDSKATLNGIPLNIKQLDPYRFAKVLTEKRRKRDPRRERLERAEATLKVVRK
jgi:hypothetical protein